MVYFMQQGETGPIKIGVSDHPQSRRKRLQTGSPHELRIIHTFIAPDDVTLENGLHKDPILKEGRMEGEWFDVPEEYQDPRLFILRQPRARVLFPCFHCGETPRGEGEMEDGFFQLHSDSGFRAFCTCGTSAPKTENPFEAVVQWNRMMEML
jgi:hypothetical protein